MRIAILGSGGVGGYFGARLARAGVDGIDACAASVGRGVVLGGVTYVFAAIEAPGRIAQTGTGARVVFGEVFDPQSSMTPRVEAVAGAFRDAGVDVQPMADARPAL